MVLQMWEEKELSEGYVTISGMGQNVLHGQFEQQRTSRCPPFPGFLKCTACNPFVTQRELPIFCYICARVFRPRRTSR